MYRVSTQTLIVENRTMRCGDLVRDDDLSGLASMFLNLGLIEATAESAQIVTPKSALVQFLERQMPPMAQA
ncbi:MAG: hypothetical protein ACAH95_08610 [Fimbriimonas sp.]